MKTGLERSNSSGALFVGIFIQTNLTNDLIVDMDPKKEFGNKPFIQTAKLPFELQKHEAIISYTYQNKVYYYKIEKLEETAPTTNYY